MGNEMGNQNVTALKEENTEAEAPEKSLQGAVIADEVKEENQIVPATENREVHEKVRELSSDDPLEAADTRVDKQTSDGREQGDTELMLPQVPIESNDEVSQESGIKTTSSFKDAEDTEKPIESNLDENLLETSDHQTHKQSFIRTETEEGERSETTIDMMSVDQKLDQNELVKVHAEAQVEEGSCWPQDEEEDIGMSLSCDEEDEGHLLETEATISLAGIVASDTDLDIEKINADLLLKGMEPEEEKSVGASICEEKCEIIREDEHDQNELVKVHAEAQLEEGSCWPQDEEEDIGMILSCDEEDEGHLLETEATISLAGIVASDTDLDIEKINADLLVKEMEPEEEKSVGASICVEKCEIIREDEVGNGLSNETTVTSISHGDFGSMNDGELPAEMILSRNGSSEAISQSNSLNCFHEVVPEPDDKCIVLTEEAKLIGSGSEDEDICDPNPIQFNEQAMEDLKIEKLDASQSISSLVGSSSDSGSENEDRYDPNPIQLYEQGMNELEAMKMSVSQSDSLLVGPNSDNGRENEDRYDPNLLQFDEKTMTQLEDEKNDASQFDLLLVYSNSDNEGADEKKYDPNPIQIYKQAMNELETQKMVASQSCSALILSNHDSNGREILADSSCRPGIGDSQIKREEVAENGYQSEFCDDKLNSASEQQLKDSEEAIELVPEIGTVPTELTVMDYKQDKEQPAENAIIDEKEEKEENSESIGSDGEESKAIEQHASQPQSVEGTASLLSPCPCSPLEPQDHKDTVKESETGEKRTSSSRDLIQESCSEIFVNKASIVDCTNSTEKTLISEFELEKEEAAGQDLPRCYIKTPVAETESLVNQSTDTIASVGCGAQERMGKLGIESNPENPIIHIEVRKAPSFDFDVSLGARCEESDQTPLLRHDKIATRRFLSQDSLDFGNLTTKAEYGGDLLKYQAMPVEEKTIKMERSDSEKLKTPFLSMLKGDGQTNVVVSPKKQDSHVSIKTKEVAITSSKGSGKRKPKASIFSTCLCCAASIH
ncbi:uncharacterized protein LOC132275082 isoform X2 [Cornus florida]|uniref:uncharacterized protein LOC132275082 isoform X2 n=1 Tax=Cornus florida TaxID=4283 RepID=UPI0028A26E45|nr:uncharacterized protein LOC132275082 isoform X2 [Cornus florida]